MLTRCVQTLDPGCADVRTSLFLKNRAEDHEARAALFSGDYIGFGVTRDRDQRLARISCLCPNLSDLCRRDVVGAKVDAVSLNSKRDISTRVDQQASGAARRLNGLHRGLR